MSAEKRKWTRAVLRRTLEDDAIFDELRRSLRDNLTEEELRARIRSVLSWQRRTLGEPYFCSYCGRPTDTSSGDVAYKVGNPLWYRAAWRRCATGKSERSDAGWES